MTKEQFTVYVNRFREYLRALAPKDTGNLAYNAIKLEWLNEKTVKIYVDGDGVTGIAPYMPFTTEPWISPKWGGKKNPNEAWWDIAIARIVNRLNHDIGGVTVGHP